MKLQSPLLILTLISLSFSLNPQFKDCNFTDFRFQSQYNLGQQDELNNTFDAINGKFTVPNLVYPINSYTNYSFTDIKTSLKYNDAKQKAQIIGNDTIVIVGGFLQATVQLNWLRKDFLERGGALQALCKSNQIMFSKNLTIEKGFLVYQVSGYYNISFEYTNCQLLRYQPANISKLDLSYIDELMNNRDDGKQTIKTALATQINQKYFYQLNNSLYNQKHQLDDKFFYLWKDQNKPITLNIQYQVIPTGVDLQKKGISFTFVTQIKDYDNWECGPTIPHINLPIDQYGGIQQFLSLSLFKNTLKYAIQQGALDTTLNYPNWKSSMFQFFAGDLYEVMPYISTKYLAKQQITGNCKALTENLVISPYEILNQLKVRTQHICDLFIQRTTKILSIKIDLYSTVEAKFEQQSKVNFYIKQVTHNLSYNQQPLFKIDNYQLANAMVSNSLKKMIGMRTFGSGWPTFKMDLPQMKPMGAGYVVFYDSTHIGQSQL